MSADSRMGYPDAGRYSADLDTEPDLFEFEDKGDYPLGVPARVLAGRMTPSPEAVAQRAERKRVQAFEREVFPNPDDSFTDRQGRRTFVASDPVAATVLMARALGEVAGRRAAQRLDEAPRGCSVFHACGLEFRVFDAPPDPEPGRAAVESDT